MDDYLILPPAFVRYVTAQGCLPMLPTTDLDMLRELIEVVCLEQTVGEVPAGAS